MGAATSQINDEFDTMTAILNNPPHNFYEAEKRFLDKYADKLENLELFSSTPQLQQYYLQTQQYYRLPTLGAILNDVSFITLIAAHIKLIFPNHVAPISCSKQHFGTGTPIGVGKGKAERTIKHRVDSLSTNIQSSFLNYQQRKQQIQDFILVNGFIRDCQNKIDKLIPTVLIELCYKYYFVNTVASHWHQMRHLPMQEVAIMWDNVQQKQV